MIAPEPQSEGQDYLEFLVNQTTMEKKQEKVEILVQEE